MLDTGYSILDTGSLPFGNSGRQCLFLPCPILAGTAARPTDDQLQATSSVGLRADQWSIVRDQRISISDLGLSRLGIWDYGFRIFVRKTFYFKPLQRALTMVVCTIFIKYPASSIDYPATSTQQPATRRELLDNKGSLDHIGNIHGFSGS